MLHEASEDMYITKSSEAISYTETIISAKASPPPRKASPHPRKASSPPRKPSSPTLKPFSPPLSKPSNSAQKPTKTAQNLRQTRSSTQALKTTPVPVKSTSTAKPTHNCLITEPGTGRVSREEVLKMIQYQESPEFQREYQAEMESKHLRAEAWQRSHGFRPHPRHGRQHSPVFK